MRRYLLPLVGFMVLMGFLAVGLRLDPREVPSPLIGTQVPNFKLPQLQSPDKFVTPADLKGQVWLLNVWASWCVSCRQEHPALVELDRQKKITIIGLNYKEVRGDAEIDWKKLSPEAELSLARQRAIAWLQSHGGDPYAISAMDLDGRTGINFGVYGVPETFLIDKDGFIRYKHIGPVTREILEKKILPIATGLGNAT